jgi:hypothetical protein
MTPDLDKIKSLLFDATIRGERINISNAHGITYIYHKSAHDGAYLLFAHTNKTRGRKRFGSLTPAEAFEYIEQNWSKRADEATRKAVIAERKRLKIQ